MYKLKNNTTPKFVKFQDGYSYLGNINKFSQNNKRIALSDPIDKPPIDFKKNDLDYINRLKYLKNEISFNNSSSKMIIESENLKNENTNEEIEIEEEKKQEPIEINKEFGEINGITSKKIKKI